MKLVPNGYDTVPNRILASQALKECLVEEKTFDLKYIKMMYGKLVAQAHHISSESRRLDLDLYDLTTVAIRLKEVLDNYLRILERAISDAERNHVLVKRHISAHCIAGADTEIRQLRFTLEHSEAVHDLAA